MISFTATLLKFEKKGEKTGWTYIEISADIAGQLKPGNKQSFRVKGKLDQFAFKQVALMPMGNGNFVMPLNATMRKGIGKRKGAMVAVKLEMDESVVPFSTDLIECLEDEPRALAFFNTLPKSHRHYFSKWVESAKTNPTKTKRITQAVNALAKSKGFGEMIKSQKEGR